MRGKSYSPALRKSLIGKVDWRRSKLGESTRAACRKVGLSQSTYDRWKRLAEVGAETRNYAEGSDLTSAPAHLTEQFRSLDDVPIAEAADEKDLLTDDPDELRAIIERVTAERDAFKQMLSEILLGRVSPAETFERLLEAHLRDRPNSR